MHRIYFHFRLFSFPLSPPFCQTAQPLEPARFPGCLCRGCRRATPARGGGIKEELAGHADSRAPPRPPGSESALSIDLAPRFLKYITAREGPCLRGPSRLSGCFCKHGWSVDPGAAGGAASLVRAPQCPSRLFVGLVLVSVWHGDIKEHVVLKSPEPREERLSFGHTQLVCSLRAAAAHLSCERERRILTHLSCV